MSSAASEWRSLPANKAEEAQKQPSGLSSSAGLKLPGVDALLRQAQAGPLIERYGRLSLREALREVLAGHRARRTPAATPEAVLAAAAQALAQAAKPSLRPVFNLTGTVLHSNLGRAPLPEAAARAAADALARPVALEFDLETGRRGRREDRVRTLLCRLGGAEDATVVNNNAAALVLILNTLAAGREVPVSRGELIEIGGSFRLPEIMARTGAKLVEVGTTNRTRRADFTRAIGPATALLLQVHPSNYAITGFIESVATKELAATAHEHGLPCVIDLGSGSLIDLSRFGLPREPMPGDCLAAGVDLVCFSADKLLGGPQAGIILGRAALVAALEANPLKRALRVDKTTLAALAEVLDLYRDPDHLAVKLPTLRLISRPLEDIRATAARIVPTVTAAAARWKVAIEPSLSRIGSGALPVVELKSAAVTIAGPGIEELARRWRQLPRPVIGRLHEGRLWLDCRCLEPAEEEEFLAQLGFAPAAI